MSGALRLLTRKVAPEKCFLRALRFAAARIMAPLLRTRLHLSTVLVRNTGGRSLCNSNQSNALWYIMQHGTEGYCQYFCAVVHELSVATAGCSFRCRLFVQLQAVRSALTT
jgi:hypothetical protein